MRGHAVAAALFLLTGVVAEAATPGDVPLAEATVPVGFVLHTGPESAGSAHHLAHVILALRISGLVYLGGESGALVYGGAGQPGTAGPCATENPLGAELSRLGWTCSVTVPSRVIPLPSR